MSFKEKIIFFTAIYTVMFLIGPWHFYGELKSKSERGIRLSDQVEDVIGAVWDNNKLKVCLKGRIDAELGEIYVELESSKVEMKSVGKYAGSEFRHIIPLSRNQYRKKCESFKNGKYQIRKDYYQTGSKSYNLETIKKEMSTITDGNYIFLRLSRDIGVNRYKNHFAIYKKDKENVRQAWFVLKGTYHKRVAPSLFDYISALVKDYFTMPYQWVAMVSYIRGGS